MPTVPKSYKAAYYAAMAADEAYSAECTRVYGPANPSRWRPHTDTQLIAVRNAKIAADQLLHEEAQKLHAAKDAAKAQVSAPLPPSAVDISTISEYGLDQKLSNPIRCF